MEIVSKQLKTSDTGAIVQATVLSNVGLRILINCFAMHINHRVLNVRKSVKAPKTKGIKIIRVRVRMNQLRKTRVRVSKKILK